MLKLLHIIHRPSSSVITISDDDDGDGLKAPNGPNRANDGNDRNDDNGGLPPPKRVKYEHPSPTASSSLTSYSSQPTPPDQDQGQVQVTRLSLPGTGTWETQKVSPSTQSAKPTAAPLPWQLPHRSPSSKQPTPKPAAPNPIEVITIDDDSDESPQTRPSLHEQKSGLQNEAASSPSRAGAPSSVTKYSVGISDTSRTPDAAAIKTSGEYTITTSTLEGLGTFPTTRVSASIWPRNAPTANGALSIAQVSSGTTPRAEFTNEVKRPCGPPPGSGRARNGSQILVPPQTPRRTAASEDGAPSGVASLPAHKTLSQQIRHSLARPLPTSPDNYRARVRVKELRQAPLSPAGSSKPQPIRWSPNRRPYLTYQVCQRLFTRNERLRRDPFDDGSVLHVDFSTDEAKYVLSSALSHLGADAAAAGDDLVGLLNACRKALRRVKKRLPELAQLLYSSPRLPGRRVEDIKAFLVDVSNRALSQSSSIIVGERDEFDRQNKLARNAAYFSLLSTYTTHGKRPLTLNGKYLDVLTGLKSVVEDEMELRVEWTNAAGDIMAVTWTSEDAFICGTTNHSDAHNQQYNKPGNLLLGSASHQTVRAYPDHRIIRPLVSKGSNATEEMIESQDPWLYTSVVYADYDARHNRAFTSSFDCTVKIWEVEKSGSSMSLLGTWPHEGRVNFVVASTHPEGIVATASDVPTKAVRVYDINEGDISASEYRSFTATRAEGEASDKWAYFPAAMRWGLSERVRDLLLVGFSPRSLDGNDDNIPEDKRSSGEIRLWNGRTGEAWKVMTASMCNVFEVAWHPTHESFIVATTPYGQKDDKTRTQIRIFGPSDGVPMAFSEKKVLDCPALDINELTCRPYSPKHAYVTASCTNGKIYIWDTGNQQSQSFQTLSHGYPLEIPCWGDREEEDVGVKFTAWGRSPDRFYSGSSDGIVKVWNVRAEGRPLVRDLLECPAAVTFGAFSPDHSKLIIGDASGRVFLLTTHDLDEDEWGGGSPSHASTAAMRAPMAQTVTIKAEDGRTVTRRRPTQIVPHAEPPEPATDAAGHPLEPATGVERARRYLERGQLRLHRDPTIGAVQGPNYAETGHFCRPAHLDGDPSQPLLAAEALRQQDAARQYSSLHLGLKRRAAREVSPARKSALAQLHSRNLGLDLDLGAISQESKLQLLREKVMLGEIEYSFTYEEILDET